MFEQVKKIFRSKKYPEGKNELKEFILRQEAEIALEELNNFWKEISVQCKFEFKFPKVKLQKIGKVSTHYNPKEKIIYIDTKFQFEIIKRLGLSFPTRYQLKIILFAIMAHEYTHHIQIEINFSKIFFKKNETNAFIYAMTKDTHAHSKAMWNKYLHKLASNEEDQADYFAGVFISHLVGKNILTEEDTQFLYELWYEIGSDSFLPHHLRADTSNPISTTRTDGGHGESLHRAGWFTIGAHENTDLGLKKASEFGLYEMWKQNQDI